jgi:prepilin signal peptidase PulO-like enzyme (type II secretory pathway)
VLVVLSAIDLEQRIVPNVIVLPATAVVLAGNLVVFPDRRLEFVGAMLGAGLLLLLPLLVYPAGMGKGDVKLAMLLGAGLGRRSCSGSWPRSSSPWASLRVAVVQRGRPGFRSCRS